MRIRDKLDRYLYDKEYKITIKGNLVDIDNYDEIVDFTSSKIVIKCQNVLIILEGNKLGITKMMDNEVLVEGSVCKISIN
jgi:sporulation protein YqfC